MSKSATHVYRPRQTIKTTMHKGLEFLVCLECNTPVGYMTRCVRCAWKQREKK